MNKKPGIAGITGARLVIIVTMWVYVFALSSFGVYVLVTDGRGPLLDYMNRTSLAIFSAPMVLVPVGALLYAGIRRFLR